MALSQVKNKHLKISPGGLITLPVAARKALAMTKGQGTQVDVAVADGAVVVSRQGEGVRQRISPRGVMDLRGKARELLSEGASRHYWIQLADDSQQVRLIAYR